VLFAFKRFQPISFNIIFLKRTNYHNNQINLSFLSRVIMMEWITKKKKKKTCYMYARVNKVGHNRNNTSANFALINDNLGHAVE
jgi:hypothetical protein